MRNINRFPIGCFIKCFHWRFQWFFVEKPVVVEKTEITNAVITTDNLTIKILSEKIGKPVAEIVKKCDEVVQKAKADTKEKAESEAKTQLSDMLIKAQDESEKAIKELMDKTEEAANKKCEESKANAKKAQETAEADAQKK